MNKRSLFRDDKGASMVEFALVLPVLLLFIFGITVMGQLFQASAGMQHALGEAARYATVYNVNTTDHLPTDAEIQSRISARLFGTYYGTFDTPTIDNSEIANGRKKITVVYRQTPNFIFFTAPTVVLTRSKWVNLSA
jgi:Flp pilus assembly protein TadG